MAALFTPGRFCIQDLECPDGVTLGLPHLDRLGILNDLALCVPDGEDLGGVEVDFASGHLPHAAAEGGAPEVAQAEEEAELLRQIDNFIGCRQP